MTLTQERLKELLHYDPDTGIFCWRVTNSNRAVAGTECRSLNGKGYVQIGVDGRRYEAQRLVWLYMTGEWPPHMVDHADMDPTNNRWANLRSATYAENMANSRALRTNSLGVKCVRKRSGRFQSHITIDGKQRFLGSFATVDEASAAYEAAAQKAFGEFARAA